MPMRSPVPIVLALALVLAAGPADAQALGGALGSRDAATPVDWRAPRIAADPVVVRILGFNDLHGQLETRTRVPVGEESHPVGGAAVLAAYLAVARADAPKRTLTVIAGDSIGASQLISGLLHDEPAMAVLNELADGACPRLTRAWSSADAPVATRCRAVSTVGNHEFDRGTAELERLLYGGRAAGEAGPGPEWAGSRIPFVAANVVRRDGQRPLLPASVVVDLDGVRIGVVGAVTAETPSLVVPERIRDLQFLPEAPAINAAVAALRARGVHTIVLAIHEGLQSPTSPQVAPLALEETEGRLAGVLAGLDGGIDVVVAGHTHKFNNVLLPLKDGSAALVVQARSYGTSFSSIDLVIDRATGGVVEKSARVIATWADAGPGREPDRRVARLVAAAAKATAAVRERPVGAAAIAIRRGEPTDPETALGDFVADATRAAAGTDFAFVNAGGIRNDIEAGPVTFASLFDVQPFGNRILRLTMTGEQVLRLLEQQWSGAHATTPRFLRVSGLRYVFDLSRPPGERVLAADDLAGHPLDPARRYTVAANDFIVGGGDGYSVLAEGAGAEPLMTDLEAVEAFIRAARAPIAAHPDGRARPFAEHPR